MGIPLRLALIGLVGSARGFELSEPLAGLSCDSETVDETLELGHRQLDVTVTNWLEAGIDLCAEECEQIAGCTTFHVMQSQCRVDLGCIDELWAECTFFSRCEAMQHGQEDWMDCSSTAYFLTDRTSAPAVPSTADRRHLEVDMDVDMAEMDFHQRMAGLSLPMYTGGSHISSMGNVFQGNSLPPIITPETVMTVVTVAPTVSEEMSPSPPSTPPSTSPPPEMPGTTVQILPAKEFKITVTAAGTVETFDKVGYETGMRTFLACEAPLCMVAVAVTAASVNVEATVTDARTGEDLPDGVLDAVAMAEQLKTMDPGALTTALGVTVTSAVAVTAPTDVQATIVIVAPSSPPPVASPSPSPPQPRSPSKRDRVGGPGVGLKGSKGSDQTTADEVGLGLGLGLGLGFPVFCAFLFFIHVQLNFAEGNRNKYLTYRFSHSNAQITFGYRPKESRDALWAEIKAPAQSSRETAVEVPVAPKKEKTDTV